VPAAAIRDFVGRLAITKSDSTIEIAMLDHSIRETLNKTAARRMAVLRPLKVVIENYPEGKTERLEAVNHPENPDAARRLVPFGREIYIERDDFLEDPPKKFFRLAPGREVRLRFAYFITCREAVKNAAGEIVELRCTYDPETRGGNAPDGRKVKATIHWVAAEDSLPAEVRLYDPLFGRPDPGADGDYLADINPQSLETVTGCRLEPSLADAEVGEAVQFERLGYFCADPDTAPGRPVFNRTIGLRDSWAKAAAKG
jgi:glutaminyl-tRNA synthetase